MNRVFVVVALLIEPQIFGFSEIKLDFSYGSATQIYLKWASQFVKIGLNSLAYKAFEQVFLHVGLQQPYACSNNIIWMSLHDGPMFSLDLFIVFGRNPLLVECSSFGMSIHGILFKDIHIFL